MGLRQRFKLFVDWITDPWPFWQGVVSAIFVMALFRHCTVSNHEHAFQYAGLTLQLLGLTAVAYGISQKLSTLGEIGLGAWFVRWCHQFLGIFARPQPNVMNAAMGTLRMLGGGGMAGQSRKKPTTPDERLDQLEADITRLDGEVKLVKEELATERRERAEADDRLHSSASNQIAEVRKLIKSTTTGTFREEIIGLVWLAFGAVCTAIPADLASFW